MPFFFFFKSATNWGTCGQIWARLSFRGNTTSVVWWGFAHCLLRGHPRKKKKKGAKISLVPVLPAHCPTLRETTKCPEAKPQAPSKRADSHGFLSSPSSPSPKQKQHLPPAWRSTLISAQQSTAGEGYLPSWKEGAAFTPQNSTKFPGRGLENSSEHRRDFKKSSEHVVSWPVSERSSSLHPTQQLFLPDHLLPGNAGFILLLEHGNSPGLQGGEVGGLCCLTLG